MQYVQLGRTGLRVSRLCLGTMNYGPEATEAEGFAQMDKALDLGINFFDTADVYGWKKGEGYTEQIVGNWFSKGGMRREKVILATKVYGDMNADPQDLTMARGLNAVKIRRACEGSLRRLKTDYIDLYQMHHINRESSWDEIWQAFDVLVKQGKVLYAGSSNFAGWHIAQANEQASKRHFLGLVSEQSKYSLLERTIELEVIPACEAYGLGLIPWSPLAAGALAGSERQSEKGRREGTTGKANREKHAQRIDQFVALCRQLGEEPANVAIAWLLHNPVVTAPIIGPRTIEQLDATLRATEIEIDAAAMAKLDEMFPGPGKPAPEAYAW